MTKKKSGVNITITPNDMRRAVQADVYASVVVLRMMDEVGATTEDRAEFEARLKTSEEELKKYDPDPDFDAIIEKMKKGKIA